MHIERNDCHAQSIGEKHPRPAAGTGTDQEQLAEAMDVSVGAVSKWEQASSMPEIPMLMKLADFFQTSVDALLGYELLNNGREESIQRLKEYFKYENL